MEVSKSFVAVPKSRRVERRLSRPLVSSGGELEGGAVDHAVMSVSGAVKKTVLLWILALVASWSTWTGGGVFAGQKGLEWWWVPVALVVAMGFAGVTCFRARWAPVTGPCYAVAEGVMFGGGLKLLMHGEGGVFLAAITISTLAVTMLLYYSGFALRVPGYLSVCISVLVGAGLAGCVGWWASGFRYLQNGSIDLSALGLSFVAVIVAVSVSINILLDLGAIADGARARAPKYMEWYSAFALLISFVWLLVEFFRLVSVVRNSRRPV